MKIQVIMKKPIKNKNSNNVQNGPDKEGKHVNHWSKKIIHSCYPTAFK
jgi:hypothetical protein